MGLQTNSIPEIEVNELLTPDLADLAVERAMLSALTGDENPGSCTYCARPGAGQNRQEENA